MSDTPQGTDWWLASDGKWYPPQDATAAAPPPPPVAPPTPTYQQPAYQQPVYQQPVVMGPRNDGFCITGLVCGIVGIVTVFMCGIGLVPGILGLVFGILGIKRVDNSRGTATGRGMGLAGAICGGVAVALFVLWVIIVFANRNSSSYYWSN